MPGRNTGRITIQDLADELGLSKSAVSNALNGAPGVSDLTRRRVHELAGRRNWRAHALARALSTGRTGTIGLCLSRSPELFSAEMYYPAMIAGAESVLAEHGCELLFRMSAPRTGADLDVYRKWAAEQRVDGVVLVDLEDDDPRVALVRELGLPAVIQGRWPASDVPVITPDPLAEASAVLCHLADLGRRHVVHIAGPATLTHERDRSTALREVGARFGITIRTLPNDYLLSSGASAVGVLAGDPWPDAVVCSSDLLALGFVTASRDAGIRIPDDLALVSWDDTLLLTLASPTVTALDRHPYDLGRAAAAALLREVGVHDVEELAVPEPRLTVRGSTVG